MYYGKETKEITRLFKEANIGVAFQTKNTIQNLVKPRLQTDGYKKSGVHQLKYSAFPG
jgi:hypothetical protein